jgi:hypothetical protein
VFDRVGFFVLRRDRHPSGRDSHILPNALFWALLSLGSWVSLGVLCLAVAKLMIVTARSVVPHRRAPLQVAGARVRTDEFVQHKRFALRYTDVNLN